MRLGQAKGAQHVATRQRLQEALLLVFIAKGHQDRADRAVVDADHGGGAAVTGCHFFQDQGQGQVIEPRAVVLGGHGHPVAAQGRQAFEFQVWKVVLLVPARRVRGDLVLHIRAHGILDGAMVFTEQHGS